MLSVAMADDREAILRSKAAIDTFPKPARGDPATAAAKNEAAKTALNEAAYETAIARLREGIQADPADPQLRDKLGRALTGFGKFDEAKEALANSIALDAGNAAAWADLGVVLAWQRQDDLAAAAFATSVAVSKPQDGAIDHLAAITRSGDAPWVAMAAARALESRTVRETAAAFVR